jgi:hypothetical protein
MYERTNTKTKNRLIRWSVLFLTMLGAGTHLLLVAKLGCINDDWYLMFDGYVGGADFFHEVFSVDCPVRGYLMQTTFSLFGMNPHPRTWKTSSISEFVSKTCQLF